MKIEADLMEARLETVWPGTYYFTSHLELNMHNIQDEDGKMMAWLSSPSNAMKKVRIIIEPVNDV